MSVMRPEGPESPRSAGLTAEKQEKGKTREARDGDAQRETHTQIRVGGKTDGDERNQSERRSGSGGEVVVTAARQPAAGFSPVNNKVPRAGHEAQTNMAIDAFAENMDAASVCDKRLRLTLKGEASHSVLNAPQQKG